jgi:ABC-type multidrug transport system fused ATPase/permease subunit
LVSTCFEVAGIGMLLPIFELLRKGRTADPNSLHGQHWEILRHVAGYFGLSITLGSLLAVTFILILLRQSLSYWTVWYEGVTKRNILNKTRQRAFYRFLLAETAIQDHSQVGAVVSILVTELSRAIIVLFAMLQFAGVLIRFLFFIGALFLLSPLMSTLSLGLIALATFLSRGLLKQIKQRGMAMTDRSIQLSVFMVERLRHARLIRLSGTEKAEAAALGQLSRSLSEQGLRQSLASTRLQLLPEPLAAAVAFLMLFIGGHIIGLSLERLGLFTIVLIRLVPVVRSVIVQHNQILGMMPSLEILDRHFAEITQTREPSGGYKSFTKLDDDIRYVHVTFSYPNTQVPALEDVTVTLPAHRMSALVGPSGAGKSTFVDLLPRLRNPTAGAIYLDGVPSTEFSTSSLRAGIAFVPQQPHIFNITAAEHIGYGKDGATDDEVRHAARLSGALPFIEALPQGFGTLLGDGGIRLSGGQRQRLDIARALLRMAPILILDEPTSAQDAEAEATFREVLRTLRKETNLTIIVIAHRLSTIVDADQIVVLRNGRAEAVGGHDELMARGGWYAEAQSHQVSARSGGKGRIMIPRL